MRRKSHGSIIVRLSILLALIAGLFGALPVRAVGVIHYAQADFTPTPFTVVVQPDASMGQDSYIYSGSKATNYGNAIDMGVGEDNNSGNRVARSLIRFDLSSIPADATINSAILSLWTSTDLSSNTRAIRVYRLKVPFNETQVTWNRSATGVAWQVAGASGANDRESTAIGSLTISSNEALSLEKQIALTPVRIQESVSGTFVNRGFIIVADTESNDRFNYGTSDSTNSGQRPKLVIQYTIPSVTPSTTATPTNTATQTPSPMGTNTLSPTFTPIPPTDTPSPTYTFTSTPTSTATKIYTPTNTLSPTATSTQTATETSAPTNQPTNTATWTPPSTFTATATNTFTPTSISTATSTRTPTLQPTDTLLPTTTSTLTLVPTIAVTPTSSTPAMGPLAVSSINPRYFADPNGNIVYLTGSHTWCSFLDCDDISPLTAIFDYNAYLDFLVARNHNFFRLWRAENARGGEVGPDFWFDPMPYQRSDTCCAFDGGNKFDLTQFNQAYFDRMRSRIIAAGERGIYVSIVLFDGWSVESKAPNHDPWAGHPYNVNNNINGIDGDTTNDDQGGETHMLSNAYIITNITPLQEAYVMKVIDTVSDLDNVLYEISNESGTSSTAWQHHMIDYVKSSEAGKPKQHPVGMTVEWPGGSNTELFNSPADWISLNGDVNNPPLATGAKVILADTDHLCGLCGDRTWVWKSFTHGENPLFMDAYDPGFFGRGASPTYDPNNANDVSLRLNLGYARSYANRINLAAMSPQPDLCSTNYCLANAAENGAEYLAYLPSGGSIQMNLSATSGVLIVEWFNPATGTSLTGSTVTGGSTRTLSAPFSGDAVLYLKSFGVSTVTPVSSPTGMSTALNTFTATAASTSTSTPTATRTSTSTPVATFMPSQTTASTFTLLTPTDTLSPTSTTAPTATRTAIATPTPTTSTGFPINPVLDDFNRANGAIGSSWSGETSEFSISSNRLTVNTSETIAIWNISTYGINQEAYMTFSHLNTVGASEHALALKIQGTGGMGSNRIEVSYFGAQHRVVVWTHDASQGWRQHGADFPITFADGDTFGALARADGTVEIYRNGVLIGSRNVSSWPHYDRTGSIGFGFYSAQGAILDNFGGGTR